jgi:nitrate reductase gamma subunit
VLYIALVYASAPLTPGVVEALGASALGRMVLAAGPVVTTVALVPVALLLARRRTQKRSQKWSQKRSIVAWVVIAGLYFVVWSGLCERAIERIHLAQYGFMSVVALRALRETVSLRLAYAGSALLTTAVSWGNELMQDVLPNRVYDLRDVAIDGIAGVLGLAIVRQVERC